MFKVCFFEKESESSLNESVMLPGTFGIKDFTEYLNSINNTHKQFRFFTLDRLWNLQDSLSSLVDGDEDVVLVEYEEEREGEVKQVTSFFPDWIKRLAVGELGVYSGGYDGAVRLGDKVLYEFGASVQALDTFNDLILTGSETEIVCIYPGGTKKTKATTQLTCLRILEVDTDGVIHFVSGHFDGRLINWRLSRKKGFTSVSESKYEGCIDEIFKHSNDLMILSMMERMAV